MSHESDFHPHTEPAPRRPGRAWTSRGYLPHFDSPHVIQHVTFRLADSLPVEAVRRVEFETRNLGRLRESERVRRLHAWIDAGHGCALLRDPAAAQIVQRAILHFDGVRYRVLAWVVMPNHAHVVLRPLGTFRVAVSVASWKSFTGRVLAGRMREALGASWTGSVWHREHFDRYVRDEAHLDALISYVERNPVAARLVARAEDWPWGSAAARVHGGWRPCWSEPEGHVG